MSSDAVVTTLSARGIGSSFNVSSTGYFVSTVPQHGVFETIVKESGLTKLPLLRPWISRDCIEAAMAHVALTRMCISENPAQWDADAVDGYLPSQLKDLLDSQTQSPTDTSLLNEYNHNLLAMAGIGYPPQRSKAGLVIIAVIVIAALLFIFH